MIKRQNRLLLLASGLFFGVTPTPLRADILDNDDDAQVVPQPELSSPAKNDEDDQGSSGTTGAEAPREAKGSAKGGSKAPKRQPQGAAEEGPEEGGGQDGADTTTRPLKAPSPHPKDGAGGSTTVIAPKNPSKGSTSKGSKGKEAANGKSARKEPVHFESKGLKGLREKGMVELLQDVVVTQADMKLESDYAQVFFDEASHEVLKVIAQGNVKINGTDENSGEHFKAVGDKAVFLNNERTVVLEGNAKLWRGEDSMIRSRKITYEMNTGWIRADRVAGEVQPPESKPVDAGKPSAKPTEKSK